MKLNCRLFFVNKVTSFAFGIFLLSVFTATAQTTRYVAPVASGAGDGSSWANASGDIQAMITASAAGDQVFVMKGVYTHTNLAITYLIRMKEGVKIYGSFQGTETSLAQRVIGTTAADSSILNGTTTPAFTTVSNTTSLTAAAVLDGFYLTNTAYRNIDNNLLGNSAVHVNATFSNLIIAGGRMSMGAGVYNAYSSPAFTNVIFRNNVATNNGGAMYNVNGSSPVLNNVIFENNSSAVNGGGMFNQGGAGDSNPVLTNVIFRNNSAVNGGGMCNNNNTANPTLNNVTFEGNSATASGGGIYNQFADPILNDVKIIGNTAVLDGGGMYNTGTSPVLNRVYVSGNTARDGGGIYSLSNANGFFNNVVISGNYSSRNGGGLYITTSNANANPTFTNVTIAGNYAATSGGGIYNGVNVTTFRPLVRNSIVYGNNSPAGPNVTNSSFITFTNSLVQGSGGSTAWIAAFGTDGGNNKDADPLFVNPVPATASGATTNGNYSLQSGVSPAADAGSAAYASNYGVIDIAGYQRVQNGIVDMGAYEEFNVVLPVSFGRISGKVTGGRLLVSWQTLTEHNNDHFEIEASTDGKHFTKIGTLASQAADGNLSQPFDYEFSMDAAAANALMGIGSFVLLAGSLMAKRSSRKVRSLSVLCFLAFAATVISCNKNDNALDSSGNKPLYVRIAQVDKDGKKAYSEVVKVVLK